MSKITAKAVAHIEDGEDEYRFGPNGGFTAILSTPSQDRDGDKLQRTEWLEPLPERLPLDMDHGMTVADTIGSFRPYFDDDVMKMDAYFASTPKAQEVRTLVKEGHITAVSVAFMTDRSKKDGTPRRELLNAGVVAIPSNRDALILDSKATDLSEPKVDVEAFIKAASGDTALTQAIHDAAVHLGAACCETLVSPDDEDGDEAEKSVVSADVKEPSIAVEVPESFDLENFKIALQEALNPPADDSPVDSPVEAAAASDEEPAPADEAVEDAAEIVEVDTDKRARDMLMALFATENL